MKLYVDLPILTVSDTNYTDIYYIVHSLLYYRSIQYVLEATAVRTQ